jgi:hypothetical protein
LKFNQKNSSMLCLGNHLVRIHKEKEISLDILNSSFAKLGIDFSEFMADVEKNTLNSN